MQGTHTSIAGHALVHVFLRVVAWIPNAGQLQVVAAVVLLAPPWTKTCLTNLSSAMCR